MTIELDTALDELDVARIDNLNMVAVQGTGVGNETAALVDACAKAVAQGHRRVSIPFPTFTATAGTDCQQCELYGANTELTGRLSNHAGLHDIKVLGQNQSDIISAPTPYRDGSPKVLWRQGANKDYVFVQKENTGYLMLGFVKNVTTTNASLATTTSDPTRHRLGEVLNAVWAGVYKHTYSAVSGAWADTPTPGNFANVVPAYDGGRALKHWAANQNGNYIEFSVKPRRGKFAFALYVGTTAAETAAVSINGVVVATITPVAAASNTIKRFYVDAAGIPDDVAATLRITHTGTNGKSIGVFGVNFYELKDWDGDDVDSLAYFRNDALYAAYLTQQSANDTVINESVSGMYGLSYHGGESSIVSDWYVNNAVQSLTVDGFIVAKNIELSTSAAVSWAAFGGGYVTIAARWRIGQGGVSHEAQLTGDVTVGELYTHMFGHPESFTESVYPLKIDLAPLVSGTRRSLGRTNRTVVRNPATGQRISSEMTMFEREQNQYGGAHLWHVVGSYNKLYYGPCLGGKMRITDIGLVSNYRFS